MLPENESFVTKPSMLMSTYRTLGYFTLALFLYVIYSKIIYPYYFGPLRNIPRAGSAPVHFSKYMYNRIIGNAGYPLQLSQEFGPIVLLSNSIVLLNDTASRKNWLTYKFPKAPSYKLFDITGPNLFSAVEKDFHVGMKKLILPAFNNKSLSAMEDTIFRVGSESLVQYIDSFLDKEAKHEFDLFHLFHCNTLDVISKLVFGTSLNTTWDQEKGLYYIEELAKSQKMLFLRSNIPFYNRVKLPMEHLFSPIILENIKHRKNTDEVHHDILQSMIDTEDPITGIKLTKSVIVEECLSILFAGMDTTANTLTWTLYELLKQPELYKLVQDEILQTFPNLNEAISVDRAKSELKHLEAAILESMRMHPVAAGPLPRVVPEGGLTVAGHYLPPKTVVAIDIYSQHNDPTYWERPREFDIQRWMGEDRDQHKNKLMGFGLGPRSCIGRDLAWNEIYLVLANLIRHFDLGLVDTQLTPTLKFLYKPEEKRMRVNISRRV